MRASRLGWLLFVLVAAPALGLDLRAQTEPLATPLVRDRVVVVQQLGERLIPVVVRGAQP